MSKCLQQFSYLKYSGIMRKRNMRFLVNIVREVEGRRASQRCFPDETQFAHFSLFSSLKNYINYSFEAEEMAQLLKVRLTTKTMRSWSFGCCVGSLLIAHVHIE